MYELKNGSSRIARVLQDSVADPAQVKILAHVLNYVPEQLVQDAQALYCYRILNDVWSNGACAGYCQMAMRDAGVPADMAAKVINALFANFGDVSVEDATDFWENH